MRSLLIGLLVLIILVFGVAVYFKWIDFSASRSPSDGTREVTVKLDENKAKDDLRYAGDRVREAARDVRDSVRDGVDRLKGQQTVKGTLESVDATQGTVTVKPEGGTVLTIQLTDETKIRVGDKPGTRDDLKTGQIVTCTHTTKDGKHACQSLTVELMK